MGERRVLIDLTGQTFGFWEVLNRASNAGTNTRWWCRCACGLERPVAAGSLRSGNSTACLKCGAQKNTRSRKESIDSRGRIILRCSKCRKMKRLDQFPKTSKAAKHSAFSWCKYCVSEQQKHLRRSKPELTLWRDAKTRAKKKNISFDLYVIDVHVPRRCPVLGYVLRPGNGTWTDHSPTIDRLDNSKGYIRDNIRVISWRANHLKSDGTAEEHEKIAKWMKENGVI